MKCEKEKCVFKVKIGLTGLKEKAEKRVVFLACIKVFVLFAPN